MDNNLFSPEPAYLPVGRRQKTRQLKDGTACIYRKGKSPRIVLNPTDTQKVFDAGHEHFRIARSPFTSQLYIIFCKPDNHSAHVWLPGGENCKSIAVGGQDTIKAVWEALGLPDETDKSLLRLTQTEPLDKSTICFRISVAE